MFKQRVFQTQLHIGSQFVPHTNKVLLGQKGLLGRGFSHGEREGPELVEEVLRFLSGNLVDVLYLAFGDLRPPSQVLVVIFLEELVEVLHKGLVRD